MPRRRRTCLFDAAAGTRMTLRAVPCVGRDFCAGRADAAPADAARYPAARPDPHSPRRLLTLTVWRVELLARPSPPVPSNQAVTVRAGPPSAERGDDRVPGAASLVPRRRDGARTPAKALIRSTPMLPERSPLLRWTGSRTVHAIRGRILRGSGVRSALAQAGEERRQRARTLGCFPARCRQGFAVDRRGRLNGDPSGRSWRSAHGGSVANSVPCVVSVIGDEASQSRGRRDTAASSRRSTGEHLKPSASGGGTCTASARAKARQQTRECEPRRDPGVCALPRL